MFTPEEMTTATELLSQEGKFNTKFAIKRTQTSKAF